MQEDKATSTVYDVILSDLIIGDDLSDDEDMLKTV